MSSNRTRKADAVEQLLEAAQDEVTLKLSVDTHVSRLSPDYLHPDLHRRFVALRSGPSVSNQSSPPPPPPPPSSDIKNRRSNEPDDDEALKTALGDDLSTRFAALKATLRSYGSSSSSGLAALEKPLPSSSSHGQDLADADDDDEEDEVERLIRWAKDAARLDPSPSSDDDHETSDDDDEDDDPKKGNGK